MLFAGEDTGLAQGGLVDAERGQVTVRDLGEKPLVVHNIKELEQYLAASKQSAITGLDLEPNDVLLPYPTIHLTIAARSQVLSRSP